MDLSAFFEVHKDLPREGPGTAKDVAWALSLAGSPRSICDLACGPGADIAALRGSGATVLAIDQHAGFVDAARARHADDDHVTVEQGDMRDLPQHPAAPFDMIWCAGALYILGLDEGLAIVRRALSGGGILAFSEPCHFTGTPGAEAVAFWEGYETRSRDAILQAVRDAGFEVLGDRKVPDAGWEAYYQPMEARIAALRPGADAALTRMLDLCADEARHWRRVRAETGYLLVVARNPA